MIPLQQHRRASNCNSKKASFLVLYSFFFSETTVSHYQTTEESTCLPSVCEADDFQMNSGNKPTLLFLCCSDGILNLLFLCFGIGCMDAGVSLLI